MRRYTLACFIISLIITSFACKKGPKGGDTPAGPITKAYIESNEDFANPERGFYRYSETNAINYTPLNETQLRNWRTLQQADGGNYQVYSSLVFRYFVLTGFNNA